MKIPLLLFTFLCFSTVFSQKEINVSYLTSSNCSSNDGRISINLLDYGDECENIFERHTLLTSESEITAKTVADIDGDGFTDIITANNTELAVQVNRQNGQFEQLIVDDDINKINLIAIADIDGDGDMDIAARHSSSRYYYLQEDDGFLKVQLRYPGEYSAEVSLLLDDSENKIIDIDNDGDMDFVRVWKDRSGDDYLELNENDGTNDYTAKNLLNTNLRIEDIMDFKLYDHDNDGDVDVALLYRNGYDDASIVKVFINDSFGNYTYINVYQLNSIYVNQLITTDVDGDGDIDIIGTGSRQNIVSTNLDNNTFDTVIMQPKDFTTEDVSLLDLNGDNTKEFVFNGGYELYWFSERCKANFQTTTYEYSIDGGINFKQENAFSGLSYGDYQVVVRDKISLETIAYAGNPISLLENTPNINEIVISDSRYCTDGTGKIEIDASLLVRTNNVFNHKGEIGGSASTYDDFDNDGDIDVIAIDDSNDNDLVYWHENLGTGQFYKHILSGLPWLDESIYKTLPMDVDNDTDKDLVIISSAGEHIAINDGNFNFNFRDLEISGFYDQLMPVSVDIDNDGDLDLLAAARGYNQLAWHENPIELTSAGDYDFVRHQIFNNISEITKIVPIDFDDDTDIDLIVSTQNRGSGDVSGGLYWFENDGMQNFTRRIIFEGHNVNNIIVEDFETDGDLDIFYSSNTKDKIIISLNDGNFNFNEFEVGLYSGYFDVSDYDSDGDKDVILKPSQNFAVLQNRDNQGFDLKFLWDKDEYLDPDSFGSNTIKGVDFDADGDIDFLFNNKFLRNDTTIKNSNSALLYSIDEGNTFQSSPVFSNLAPASYNIKFKYEDCIYDYDQTLEVKGRYPISIDNISTQAPTIENPKSGVIDIEAKLDDIDYCGEFKDEEKYLISGIQIGRKSARLVDYDNDGLVDIISNHMQRLVWFKNLGDGSFQEILIIGEAIYAFNIFDSNSDGRKDIIATLYSNSQKLYNFEQNPNQTHTRVEFVDVSNPYLNGYVSPMHVSDIDANGHADCIYYFNDNAYIALNNSNQVPTTHQLNIGVRGERVIDIKTADVNLDGHQDMIVAYEGWFRVFANDGAFNFTEIGTYTSNNGSQKIQIKDINNDGYIDIFTRGDYNINWFSNSGSGNFELVENIEVAQYNYNTRLADFNNDGFPDLYYDTNSIYEDSVERFWLKNDGTGVFSNPIKIPQGNNEEGNVYISDFDTDSDIDIVAITDGSISVYENLCQNDSGTLLSYSIDGGNSFQDTPRFENLEFDSPYNVIVRGTNNSCQESIYEENPIIFRTNDQDKDGILDDQDNCPNTANPLQEDSNNNGIGDVCENDPLQVTTVKISAVSCNGSQDATIQIDAVGGVKPYQYILLDENQNVIIPAQAINLFEDLRHGNYIVKVIDDTSAESFSNTITIDEPEELQASSTKTNVSCNGADDAIIEVDASGGLAPYQYRVNSGSLTNNNIFSNLSPATYLITVIDSNGCQKTNNVLIGEPEILAIDANKSDITCKGLNDGNIIVYGSGGTAPYEYSFDGTNYSANNNFNDLVSATYNVFVKDASGCTQTIQVVVSEPNSPDFDNDGLGDYCDDDIDGDGIANENDQCFTTPLGSSVNTNGCLVFSLPANNFTVQTSSASCPNNTNGSINISAILSYDYTATLTGNSINEIKQFGNTLNFENLGAGIYDVCITIAEYSDFEQCFSVEITEPEALSVSSKMDISGKSVVLNLSGGINYSVNLNGTIYNTDENEIMLPLSKIENSLTVSTDMECQGIHEETILMAFELSVYPNPVEKGDVTVILEDNSINDVRLSLYTSSGRQIFGKTAEVVNGVVKINMDGFSSGMYSLNIETSNNTYTKKIIKK